MVFSSNLFLFGFLPLTLTFYFLTPPRFRNAYLLVTSLFFYFWGSGPVVFVFIFCMVVNYYGGLWIHRSSRSRARALLFTCLAFDLGILIYFKYFNFLSDQISTVLGWFHFQWSSDFRVVLPIGVSFFVFKAMSYPIEVYRQIETPSRRLVDFGTWLSLFPDFIAGPIVRYSDISRELTSRTSNIDLFWDGMTRFALGLGKKVLIANHLGLVADRVFKLPDGEATAGVAWLGLICYTLQIYYDFSGYSDMAIGLGRFFGFHFPENFNQPYRAQSVTEFWRRWHMTLSSWFRDFVWFPLGANRRGPLRSSANLFLVFVLCGLWHGAAWTFILWGVYYGILLAAELAVKYRFKVQPSGVFGNIYTLIAVMLGWALFRSPDVASALRFVKVLFGMGANTGAFVHFPWQTYLTRDVLVYMMAAIVFAWLPKEWFERRPFWTSTPGVALTGVVSLLLILYSAIGISTAGFNPFIYFRF